MNITEALVLAVALAIGLQVANAVTAPSTSQPAPPSVPDRAQDVQPLEKDQAAADVQVRTPEGEAVALGTLYREGPTMLVFYRGGWCPYCNVQLAALAEAEPELKELGFQVLAISPDRPEKLREALDEKNFSYRLLSDADMTAGRAFGLAFRVDDPTVEQYKGFGIDLEEASGEDHQLLPVPAVYLIDREGVIRFAHWDADYKQRLDTEALLEAARSVTKAESDR